VSDPFPTRTEKSDGATAGALANLGPNVEASVEPSVADNDRVGLRSISSRVALPKFEDIVAALAIESITYDLAIVIPMYREASRIRRSIRHLASSALCGERVAFLFVDDGSPDTTIATAKAAIQEFGLLNATVLPLPQNVGKGGAVKAGMLAAVRDARYVGFLDADLSLDPSDVAAAFTRMVTMDCDVLIGDRVVQFEHQPKFRRLASVTFRAIASRIAPTGVRDSQCAMKLFRSSVARPLFESMQTDGFAFDVELLVRARLLKLDVSELPIEWQPQPGSSVNPVSDSIRMLREVRAVRRRLLA
jgi:glycosyltransferase involved in cell wall biosynthesis